MKCEDAENQWAEDMNLTVREDGLFVNNPRHPPSLQDADQLNISATSAGGLDRSFGFDLIGDKSPPSHHRPERKVVSINMWCHGL